MKVILLEDVKSLGKKGQLVEVNAGYARNFILPKKLGIEATSKNINDLKLQKAHEDKVAAEQLAAAKVLAEELHKRNRSRSQRTARIRARQKENLRRRTNQEPWRTQCKD